MSSTGRPPAVSGELCGLEAIARRMQTTPETIMLWYAAAGFPMFRRRHEGRWVWVAHEASIAHWHVTRSSHESPVDDCHD